MPDAPPPVHPGPTAGGDGQVSEEVLADFRAWLAAGGEPAPEPLDLTAVVWEFTALRHDVQLQTKATRAAVEKLGTPPDVREVQRPLVEALADIADALRTAREAIRPVEPVTGTVRKPGRVQRWLFGPSTDVLLAETVQRQADRLAAVGDGYALSLKRVERALTAAGLEPIPAVGERFDPTLMEAVELAAGGDAVSGTVLAESRRGYRWYGAVFRFARVTVAR